MSKFICSEMWKENDDVYADVIMHGFRLGSLLFWGALSHSELANGQSEERG